MNESEGDRCGENKHVSAEVPLEYTCLDDRRIELHSVIRSMIKETAYQKDYIWNTSPIHICDPDSAHTDSSGSVLQNKNADHLELVDLKTDMANRARRRGKMCGTAVC